MKTNDVPLYNTEAQAVFNAQQCCQNARLALLNAEERYKEASAELERVTALLKPYVLVRGTRKLLPLKDGSMLLVEHNVYGDPHCCVLDIDYVPPPAP